MSEVRIIPIQGGAAEYDLEDIESISFTLRKPVEEPFEVTSPPLK